MTYNLTLYSKNDCPYCSKLKDELKKYSNKISLTIIEEDNKEEREKLYNKWGLHGAKATMPQLFLTNNYGHIERIGDSKESIEWLEVIFS